MRLREEGHMGRGEREREIERERGLATNRDEGMNHAKKK